MKTWRLEKFSNRDFLRREKVAELFYASERKNCKQNSSLIRNFLLNSNTHTQNFRFCKTQFCTEKDLNRNLVTQEGAKILFTSKNTCKSPSSTQHKSNKTQSAILSFSQNADKRPETAFCAAFYQNLGRHSPAADLRHLLHYKRNFEKIMLLAEFGDSRGVNLQGMESPVFHRWRSADTAISYCR